MVSTVPSSDQVQSPVVPLVAALAVILNNPIGIIEIINITDNNTDKNFFILKFLLFPTNFHLQIHKYIFGICGLRSNLII